MRDEIEEFIRREQLKKSDGTARRRRTDLNQFTNWLEEDGRGDITDLGPKDVEDYLLYLIDHDYSESTVRGRHVSINLMYQAFTGTLDVMDENPAADVDISAFTGHLNMTTKKEEVLKEDITYITPAQKEMLCDHIPDPPLRNELIVRLLWQTGIREKELVNIRLSDLDREDRSINIRTTKTHQNRTVYYQPSLDILMDQWVDGGYRLSYKPAESSPYLFLSFCSDKMNKKTVNEVVKEGASDAGFQEPLYEDAAGQTRWKITAHTLRHSYAVQSLKNGMDIRRLSKLMGHASLETTKKYLRVTESDLQDAARQFGPGTEDIKQE